MLMEPNDFQPSSLVPAESQNYYSQNEFTPITAAYINLDRSDQPSAAAIPLVDAQTQAAQNFLPSFFRDVQPLGHSRPYYNNDQQTQQQNTRFNAQRSYDQTLLGSGDFGVIRGGTFYQDNDPPARGIESNDYYNYYNNGHGRPQAAPYVQQHQPAQYNYAADDQFSNFRDFADINTPTDPAYSQFVVVYANKNSTASTSHPNPKNIFEQLQLLDQEVVEEKKTATSKFKTKLANTKLEKKYKKKLGPKETDYEPLLALS